MSTAIARNFQIGIDPTPTNNFTLYQPATPDGTLRLGNGNTGITSSLLTLTSAGNLGLGVTPSAWWSSVKALQVSGASLLSAGTEATLSANAFLDSGITWRYRVNGNATYAEQASGAFRWYTAPSGTAGNAISFTQAMTLDASGNLGIGTSSPATRLHAQTTGADIEVRATTISSGNVRFGFDASGAFYNWIQTDRASGALQFAQGNTERMRIDSSGNLLVNTTTNTNSSRIVSNGVIESTSGGVRFPDGTTQTTAASGGASTAFDGVGSYAILMMAANTNLATGGTIAGSSLRYDSSQAQPSSTAFGNNPFVFLYRNAGGNSTYTFGGTAVSGTWRKMSPGSTYATDGYGIPFRGFALYVRIS